MDSVIVVCVPVMLVPDRDVPVIVVPVSAKLFGGAVRRTFGNFVELCRVGVGGTSDSESSITSIRSEGDLALGVLTARADRCREDSRGVPSLGEDSWWIGYTRIPSSGRVDFWGVTLMPSSWVFFLGFS